MPRQDNITDKHQYALTIWQIYALTAIKISASSSSVFKCQMDFSELENHWEMNKIPNCGVPESSCLMLPNTNAN